MGQQGRRYDRDPFLDGGGHFPGVDDSRDCSGRSAAVVGGAMSGLAAAYALRTLGYEVALYERQTYSTKQVNCGEAMTAASAIPLAPLHPFDSADHRDCTPMCYRPPRSDRTR